MAYTTVLTSIPKKITVGESVSWKVGFPDFPASVLWVLTYTLVNSTTRIQIIGAADGNAHLIEIPVAVSDVYSEGEYHYQAHVSNGTERYKVGEGEIEIVPDFATKLDGLDNRKWYDVAIDALEASIQGRASKTQIFQTVGGVQIQHMSLAQQIDAMRDLKKVRYTTGGKLFKKTILSRFKS